MLRAMNTHVLTGNGTMKKANLKTMYIGWKY